MCFLFLPSNFPTINDVIALNTWYDPKHMYLKIDRHK